MGSPPTLTVVTLAPHRTAWMRGCFVDTRCPPVLLRWEARDPAAYAARFMLFQSDWVMRFLDEAEAI